MMAFKVRLFSESPDYETLHVAKLTDFPLETRDYKPYSQARICFAPDGLHLQLIAFEATPLPESAVHAVLQFSADAPTLSLVIYANQQLSFPKDVAVTSHFFTGEDLQGVFWGCNLMIPFSNLAPYFKTFSPTAGMLFRGNFYKICENPIRPHYGCYYPANFEHPLSDAKNLGEFVVIDY